MELLQKIESEMLDSFVYCLQKTEMVQCKVFVWNSRKLGSFTSAPHSFQGQFLGSPTTPCLWPRCGPGAALPPWADPSGAGDPGTPTTAMPFQKMSWYCQEQECSCDFSSDSYVSSFVNHHSGVNANISFSSNSCTL